MTAPAPRSWLVIARLFLGGLALRLALAPAALVLVEAVRR